MNILKNKFTQMILVGLLMALILGLSSSLFHTSIKSPEIEKKVVIINSEAINPFFKGITGSNNIYQNLKFKNNPINDEFNNSISYTLLRYQTDDRLSGGCQKINRKLTDNTIFIETINYKVENKETLDQCLDNLFEMSFNRLKQKLIGTTNEELSRLKFLSGDLISSIKKQNAEKKLNYENSSNGMNPSIVDKMCEEMEPVYNYVLKGVDLFSINSLNIANKDNSILIPSLFQNILALNTLAKECDQIDKRVIDRQIDNLNNLESILGMSQKVVMQSKFEDIFKIEQFSVIESQKKDPYLNKKNIVTAFSLFGFLFGVLLVYNLRISK